MRCESELKTFREFSRALKVEPVGVFVNATIDGRSRTLTLLTCMEIDPELEVHGPDSGWRANVRREFGKLVVVPLRLRKRPLSGRKILLSRTSVTFTAS